MNIGFDSVLFNIAAMILMAVPGFIIVKARLKDFSEGLVFLLLYICQPLLSFVSLQKVAYTGDILKNMGISAIFSFVGLGLLFVLSFPVFKKFEIDKAKVYRYGAVFSNCGFMGIPLLQSLFGNTNPEIIVYANIFITFFNIYSWTAGVFAVSGDKSYISIKKAFLNPPTLAFLIALPLFLLKINLESLSLFTNRIMYSLSAVANMITPLSMIIIGIKLAKMNIKQIFMSKGVYAASFVKLIFAPLLMLVIMLPFKIEITVLTAIVFCMAMPTATTTAIFAQKFGANPEEASSLVLVSTILCLVTVPFIFLIISLV